MEKKFIPEFEKESFACPHCQVVAEMKWVMPSMVQNDICNNLDIILNCKDSYFYLSENNKNKIYAVKEVASFLKNYLYPFCICSHCNKINIWIDEKMIYPKPRLTPLPNEDLPDNIKEIYEEASSILQDSPRGACALLRLALQELMIYLGEDKNIHTAIMNLIENKKIDETLKQALDSVRVIGNEAVHPNTLDLKDNVEIATALFKIINYIAEKILTDKKYIDEIYRLLPENKKIKDK